MRKLFFIVLLAATVCACTNETVESFNEEVVNENVNSWRFEDETENKGFRKNPIDYDKFVKSCVQIIEMHIQFDYFRDSLPKGLLEQFLTGNYSIDEAVHGIFLWWANEDTHEVLVEWTVFDDFMTNLPDKYFDEYPFYW